jgi:hypothetical protein
MKFGRHRLRRGPDHREERVGNRKPDTVPGFEGPGGEVKVQLQVVDLAGFEQLGLEP